MSSTVQFEMKGLEEAIAKMNQIGDGLAGSELENGFWDAAMMLNAEAQTNLVGYQSPSVGGVDTGALRQSIEPDVQAGVGEITATVGSALDYSQYVEFDTRPHWPPISALEGWARRHGADPFLVALGISRRGTVGKKFLKRAAEENGQNAVDLVARAVELIIGRA